MTTTSEGTASSTALSRSTANDAPQRSTSRKKTEMTADGSKPESLVNSIRLLVAYREVVWSFVRRSLQVRYKQSVLGVLWAALQPLATLVIFVIFFGKVAKVSGGGVPYAAFAISALGPWQFVNSGLSFGSMSLINEGSLLRKVYFPKEAPVLGAVGSNLVDLGIMVVLLLILEPVLGGQFGPSLVTLPLLIILLMAPTLGLCLFLSGLAVFYRDVKYVVPFSVQFLMFASPVAYPVSSIPAKWQPLYAAINPFVGPLDGFRNVFALGQFPDWKLLGISAVTGFLVLFVSYELFKHLEPEMADVI